MPIHSGRKLRNFEVSKVPPDTVSKAKNILCPWGNMWGACECVCVCRYIRRTKYLEKIHQNDVHNSKL